MSAYLITNLDVNDAKDFEEYRADVPALIRKHGGEIPGPRRNLYCATQKARKSPQERSRRR
jgi:hypothetical protein